VVSWWCWWCWTGVLETQEDHTGLQEACEWMHARLADTRRGEPLLVDNLIN
jgi:hypothetical protein